jgi:TolB-like protein/tetratricopeptide (TPR) repeat protein/tRNA A-37 threonylcarbamoyl transferase component Bud32
VTGGGLVLVTDSTGPLRQPLLDDISAQFAEALRDRYVLERELGRGGMATVFLAQDLKHKRPVALKVLLPELAASLGADRFHREIEIAARLQHPHILTVLDSGESAGQLWFTMPYVEGESLRARLTRERQLPMEDALRIAREAALALAYAHEHGVIHRDIKPENILLTKDGSTLVADFGIARAFGGGSEQLTETGMAVGTPAYMSPEQAAGEHALDARTDVYSLAVVLYEMLAGEPPYTGATAQVILARRFSETPRPLRTVRETIPEAIDQAVQKALAKAPADRFTTAVQFAQALIPTVTTSTATAALSPAAMAISGPGALSRPTRRRPIPVAALMLGLGFAIGLGVLFAWRRSHGGVEESVGPKPLAVLPFENLGRPEDEYFADGITEEITSRLAAVPGLRVISRTSAMQYKATRKSVHQIGQELGVAYVLEGSVRWERAGTGPSRVRVTPQLIRVSDDSHVWADRYDAVLAEVFEVQSTVAERVVTALGVALSEPERQVLAARPTANLEAYDYYLRGNDYANRGFAEDDQRAAAQMYGKAIALDSTFALAWAKLAQTQAQIYWFYYDRTAEQVARSKAAAERALRLEPNLPEAHLALGYYYYWGQRDYERALEEFSIVQKRQPHDAGLLAAIGRVQRRQGRWDEALANMKRAAELEPGSNGYSFDVGETGVIMRRYAEAERYLDRSIALAPDAGEAYFMKVVLYLNWLGDVDKASQVVRQALARMDLGKLIAGPAPNLPSIAFVMARDSASFPGVETMARSSFRSDSVAYLSFKADFSRLRGQPQRARAYYDSLLTVLEAEVRLRPEDDEFHAILGLVYARLGRKADAIREGREAVALLPLSKDAYFGGGEVINLAVIYATVGEPDTALDQLEAALKVPSGISVARLRVDPTFAPLKRNPRFERLAAGK